MESLFELYDNLHVKKDFLIALTSNLDEFYSKKIEPKMKFGRRQENEVCCKLRHIVPPKRSLKIIQRRVNKQLKKIKLPDCMYGSITKRSNILNALQHIENNFFLTIDLKNFFSRINNNQVHSTFIDNGYCWETARILSENASNTAKNEAEKTANNVNNEAKKADRDYRDERERRNDI